MTYSAGPAADIVGTVPVAFSWKHGEQEVDNTAVNLPDQECAYCFLQNPSTNGNNVYIGNSSSVSVPDATTDTNAGLELKPGDTSPPLACANLNEWWAIADAVDQSLVFMAADHTG